MTPTNVRQTNADISRRRMLLGLAAASTAAATATVATGIQAATPTENPKLIALFEQLPAVAAAFHKVNDVYRMEYKAWSAKTPWAPDELTVHGTGWPNEVGGQPGEPEMKVLGGFLWRKGDTCPRRIVVKSWQVDTKIWRQRQAKRQAKKAGSLSDSMAADAEIKRLKKLHATALAYEQHYDETKRQAEAWFESVDKPTAQRAALESHVAAIMDEPDFTMEGLVIKAQALAEWDRVGNDWGGRLAVGREWHSQIAASILRYAQGGAA